MRWESWKSVPRGQQVLAVLSGVVEEAFPQVEEYSTASRPTCILWNFYLKTLNFVKKKKKEFIPFDE